MRDGLKELLKTTKPKTIRGAWRSSRKSALWCLKNIADMDDKLKAVLEQQVADTEADLVELDRIIAEETAK